MYHPLNTGAVMDEMIFRINILSHAKTAGLGAEFLESITSNVSLVRTDWNLDNPRRGEQLNP